MNMYQDNILSSIDNFLKKEKQLEREGKDNSSKYDELRFVGYALEMGFDKTVIITSDPYKVNVGGIPRNSFLIMIPENYEQFPSHFILLQVLDTAETPLKQEVQQTYFELHKRSMPELDRFTQGELQWGALETDILGMFYQSPDDNKIEFSHDLVNYVSAHKYRVYSPPDDILDIITNSLIPQEKQFTIGKLRVTENKFPVNKRSFPNVDVKVSIRDFLGARTALFGKTRLGKSNTVKILASSVIETSEKDDQIGQLIFDIDGEYANDNLQDESKSIYSMYEDQCEVYSFNPKNEKQKPLKMNFFLHPNESITILRDLLEDDQKKSNYITNFSNTDLPSFDEVEQIEDWGDKIRAKRLILIYWAILIKSDFQIDNTQLTNTIPFGSTDNHLGLRYNQDLLNAAYALKRKDRPDVIDSSRSLQYEFEIISNYIQSNKRDESLMTSNGGTSLFNPSDEALLKFLNPKSGSGPSVLSPYRKYHSSEGTDSITDILHSLDDGKTVILDLSNAHPSVLKYFSKRLSYAVFQHQEEKFVENNLSKDNYVQIYFEEAHNLFPKEDDQDVPDIYKRIGKEGAKFHIGMIYSTQSVSSINPDLLAQTENFFITHLLSQDEVRILNKTNLFFSNYERDILKGKTVGYLRIFTRSNRFVIPVQINKFESQSSIKTSESPNMDKGDL